MFYAIRLVTMSNEAYGAVVDAPDRVGAFVLATEVMAENDPGGAVRSIEILAESREPGGLLWGEGRD